MPSSWSSRFLPTNSSNTPSRPAGTRANTNPRDKPLPHRPPAATIDPPVLSGRDGARAGSSPNRPQTSGGRQLAHTRSTSHPLPKLFGRKKSTGNMNEGYHDTDVPLDDDLVPVLPDQLAPTRSISEAKRGPGAATSVGGRANAAEDEDKIKRRCMCCDTLVNVPRPLNKFRCMCCLTINDLRPVEEQHEEERQRMFAVKNGGAPPTGQREGFPEGPPPVKRVAPLTIERTRALIDKCLVTYLEERCLQGQHLVPSSERRTPGERDNPMNGLPIRSTPKSLTPNYADQALSSSPIKMFQPGEPMPSTSAGIRDSPDFDQFAHSRHDTPSTESWPMPPGHVPQDQTPARPNRRPPPPPIDTAGRRPSHRLHPTSGIGPNTEHHSRQPISPRQPAQEAEQRRRYDRVKTIFRPLEDHFVQAFSDFKTLNTAFSTNRPHTVARAKSESNVGTLPPEPENDLHPSAVDLSQLDAKTLLLGDIGENSMWWTGKLGRGEKDKTLKRKKVGEGSRRPVTSKSPNINWAELAQWYDLIHTAGDDWRDHVVRVKSSIHGNVSTESLEGAANLEAIAEDIFEAREHSIRALLKVTENVLKRPGRVIKEPEDLRFLLVVLANPSLYPSLARQRTPARTPSGRHGPNQPSSPPASPKKSPGREGTQHTGILKRIFGLLAHSPDNCQRYLIGWFSRFDEVHFTRIVDLVSSYVTHRLVRKSHRPRSKSTNATNGLIPDLSGSAMHVSVQLQSAMGLGGSTKKKPNEPDQEPDYATDWQTKAAARLMAALFAANNIWQGKPKNGVAKGAGYSLTTDDPPPVPAKRSGQLLHTSSFYNTLLDYGDIIADFRLWESKRGDKFSFCQFPLFLSMGSKIKILEYDARRQMEIKAREAYFDSVIRQRALDGHFHLRVRRDCMVDDSLRQISEAVGSGQEELKKGLRVHFAGEEGVDAGGPRKEWFLMIVRDIFDPNHGMFVYDDEANTCYFNPHSFETSDQYHLVGALLGLAIYNSTILDIALPPFAFRKLLAAAPAASTASAPISSLTGTKGQMTYTLADLAEFRPSLAAGLQQLLDYDGDVESTYCWSFVAPVERYGTVHDVPLVSNGEAIPVTNANRHDFVDAYVRYLLDTAVTRQFEPFKRGFFHVCAGNALSLFCAEEIELLIRGSDEALDVNSLRAVAVYENWRQPVPPHQIVPNPAEEVDVLRWFWSVFSRATPADQRKLLAFITGSDRIPAVGATNLVLRIVCGGDGHAVAGAGADRFPVARTCFNMLVLWRYPSRQVLEDRIWRAVGESEGFGLK